jgi:predicted transposase YdaD
VLKQLEILSKLRKLQGISEGKREGVKEGKKETMIDTIEKILKDNLLSYQKIAQYFDVSIEFVQEIANKIKK